MSCDSENGVSPGGWSPQCIGFHTSAVAAGQTIVAATWTKVDFTSVRYDSGGFFALATDRWTPPEGLVVLDARIDVTIAQARDVQCALYKNGVLFLRGNRFSSAIAGTSQLGAVGCWQDQASGTDFYELWWQHSDPVNRTLGTASSITYFAGMCAGIPCQSINGAV
jgi:hypothetical protein